jgi:hypothetical protein
LLDNACSTHFYYINQLSDKIQSDARAVFNRKQEEIRVLHENFQVQYEKMKEENQKLREKIQRKKKTMNE